MSFLGGAECSTAANPLAQFSKHAQDDKSLQRDRLGLGQGSRMQESMRSQAMHPGQENMMDEFMQQPAQLPTGPAPGPWQMEQMRKELHHISQANGSNGWAAEFDPGINAEPMQARAGMPGFSAAEFSQFHQANGPAVAQSVSPLNGTANTMAPAYRSPMAMNYGMGGMMGMRSYNPMFQAQAPIGAQQQEGKGKGRMVELDDQDWEAQFAQLEQVDVNEGVLDGEANAAIERELNDLDRSLVEDSDAFADAMGNLDSFGDWADFDGLNTISGAEPSFGEYMFEINNPLLEHANPYDEGVRIMDSGGNLSLAALAFEAAVQKDGTHVDAWVRLGSAQAQNEKETPAIRALEEAIKIDANNLEALMGLAVSYTNESYESSAYRTLERWINAKYPQVITEPLDEPKELGFTSRMALHQKVTDLFIRAAQLSPHGDQMDPDVQVGLGVLFYAADEFDKAVDCFEAALASSEAGIANRQSNLHLLWNRLGATLANSGRSEEAIQAYERALELRPNFVRARYNLGVSCINIGVLPEAAGHLLGALSMHQITARESREKAREIVGGGADISDAELDKLIAMNESTNLYDTLRRVFTNMGRKDLTEIVRPGMDLNIFRKEFDF